MNIKFSHKYPKLVSHDGNICEMARLLDVININIENFKHTLLEGTYQ